MGGRPSQKPVLCHSLPCPPGPARAFSGSPVTSPAMSLVPICRRDTHPLGRGTVCGLLESSSISGPLLPTPPRKLLGLLFIPKTPGHFGNADPGADPHARAAGRVGGPPPCRPRDAHPTLTLQFPLVAGRAPGEPAAAAAGPRPAPHTAEGLGAPLWPPQRCPFRVVASARRCFSSVPADPGSCSPRAGPGLSGLRGAGHPSLGTRAPCSGRRGDGAPEADRDSLMEAGGRSKSRALGVGAGSVWLCGHVGTGPSADRSPGNRCLHTEPLASRGGPDVLTAVVAADGPPGT